MNNKMITEELNEFYEISKRYCSLIENDILRHDNCLEYISVLMKLYIGAAKIPLEGKQYIPKIVKDKIKKMKANSCELIKSDVQDSYAQVFNPFSPKDELDFYYVTGDLLEIYQDVKEGIILFEENYKYEAMFTWSFGFHNHYGRHLISVLRPLHALLTDEDISSYMKGMDNYEGH